MLGEKFSLTAPSLWKGDQSSELRISAVVVSSTRREGEPGGPILLIVRAIVGVDLMAGVWVTVTAIKIVRDGVADGKVVVEGEVVAVGVRVGVLVTEGLLEGVRLTVGVLEGVRERDGLGEGARVTEGLREGVRLWEGV